MELLEYTNISLYQQVFIQTIKSHRKPKNHTEHKSTQKHTKAFWQIHKTFNAKDLEFFCHDLLFFLSKN